MLLITVYELQYLSLNLLHRLCLNYINTHTHTHTHVFYNYMSQDIKLSDALDHSK